MFGFEFYHIRIDFFSISSISTRTWDTGRLGRVLPCDIPNEKDCTKCLGIPAFNGSGCYTIDSTHLSNVTKSECVYFTCSPSRTHTQISTHKQALSFFLSAGCMAHPLLDACVRARLIGSGGADCHNCLLRGDSRNVKLPCRQHELRLAV